MPRPPISLKARALRYLAAREHSRLELGRKLGRHAGEGDDVDALLDWLEAQKFLSESRFSESLVHRRANRFGNSRILAELRGHGVENDGLAGVRDQLAATEIDRAREVWQRKFGRPPADPAERAKQMRFLQQRGFSHRAIRAAMQSAPDDEE